MAVALRKESWHIPNHTSIPFKVSMGDGKELTFGDAHGSEHSVAAVFSDESIERKLLSTLSSGESFMISFVKGTEMPWLISGDGNKQAFHAMFECIQQISAESDPKSKPY